MLSCYILADKTVDSTAQCMFQHHKVKEFPFGKPQSLISFVSALLQHGCVDSEWYKQVVTSCVRWQWGREETKLSVGATPPHSSRCLFSSEYMSVCLVDRAQWNALCQRAHAWKENSISGERRLHLTVHVVLNVCFHLHAVQACQTLLIPEARKKCEMWPEIKYITFTTSYNHFTPGEKNCFLLSALL